MRIGGIELIQSRIRAVVGKCGLDGHSRGARFVANVLKNVGLEVIYIGEFQTVENVVQIAEEEDVELIALSYLSGEYKTYIPQIIDLLKDKITNREIALIVGGLIPETDQQWLKEIGVKEVFNQETKSEDILKFIEKEYGTSCTNNLA